MTFDNYDAILAVPPLKDVGGRLKSIIFFDLETGGLDPSKHPIIQIAAAVVNVDSGAILNTYERKVSFDEAACEPAALQVNSYDPLTWPNLSVPIKQVVAEFADMCRRNAWLTKISKKGNPYRVSVVGGYNVATFDMPFIIKAFDGEFFPADFIPVDVILMAQNYFLFGAGKDKKRPKSMKLTDVCIELGLRTEEQCKDLAHDAMFDIIATVDLFNALAGN